MTYRKTTGRHDFHADWPVPDAYLLELGRLMCMWGSLEAMMVFAVSKLAGYPALTDWRAHVMMAHATFQQRADVVETLCEQLLPEYPHLANYKAVVKLVRAAQQSRNKYAHNGLIDDGKGGVNIAWVSARGTFKATVEIVPLAELKEVTAKGSRSIHRLRVSRHSSKARFQRMRFGCGNGKMQRPVIAGTPKMEAGQAWESTICFLKGNVERGVKCRMSTSTTRYRRS